MSLAERLLPQIRAILASSDLSTVSAKAVRKELVRRGADEAQVKENRKDIDERISTLYDELTSGAAPPSRSPPPSSSARPSSSAHAAHPQSSLPEPLRNAPQHTIKREVKREEKPRPADLSLNGELGAAETDAEMAARLQAEYDALGSGRASRSSGAGAGAGGRAKKAKKAVVKRKSRAEVSDDEDDGEGGGGKKKRRAGGGGGAFNKEMLLSDSLSALLGEERLSRPQTVKRIWDYVKEHNLQEPTDKRYINCDAALRAVFHSDRIHMFTMNKFLSKHFMDPDEVALPGEAKPAVHRPEAVVAAKVESKPKPAAVMGRSAEIVDEAEYESEGDEDGYY